ncbi:hypothetical protein F5879DRAFT_961034 [Lentinula edodes]|nr:hypothetical protein F5879DRAFT_961034 [Lentinula edodes]
MGSHRNPFSTLQVVCWFFFSFCSLHLPLKTPSFFFTSKQCPAIVPTDTQGDFIRTLDPRSCLKTMIWKNLDSSLGFSSNSWLISSPMVDDRNASTSLKILYHRVFLIWLARGDDIRWPTLILTFFYVFMFNAKKFLDFPRKVGQLESVSTTQLRKSMRVLVDLG